MITAICMNPAFDKTVTVEALTPGRVNRVSQGRVDASGKAVNVAIVLNRLDTQVRCIGCAGVDGAERFRAMLDQKGLDHAFLTVPGTLRTNLKVIDRSSGDVTELNEPGAAVEGETLEAFFRMAEETAQDSEMVAITGSLPPGCPPGTYRELIRRMDCPCILDVSGRALLLGLEAKPWLIKPNIHELEATLGRKLAGRQEIIVAAGEMMAMGAQNVLVSLGGDGALLVTPDHAYFAPPVHVDVKSTVGAGDSMVGGFIKGMEASGGNVAEGLRWGVACATASIMTEGTQLLIPSDVMTLLDQIVIREV